MEIEVEGKFQHETLQCLLGVEGEFYGPPLSDPKLPEAVKNHYHPGIPNIWEISQPGSPLVIVESESETPGITGSLVDSLPHLDAQERSSLAPHYLGATTWQTVCSATGVDFSLLPHSTSDVVRDFMTGCLELKK